MFDTIFRHMFAIDEYFSTRCSYLPKNILKYKMGRFNSIVLIVFLPMITIHYFRLLELFCDRTYDHETNRNSKMPHTKMTGYFKQRFFFDDPEDIIGDLNKI
jgi:hypothetical protein